MPQRRWILENPLKLAFRAWLMTALLQGVSRGTQHTSTTNTHTYTHMSLCQCEHHKNIMVCIDALVYPARNTPDLKELLERATLPQPADKTPRTETRGLQTSRKLPDAEPIKHKTSESGDENNTHTHTHSESCKAGQTCLFGPDQHSQEKPTGHALTTASDVITTCSCECSSANGRTAPNLAFQFRQYELRGRRLTSNHFTAALVQSNHSKGFKTTLIWSTHRTNPSASSHPYTYITPHFFIWVVTCVRFSMFHNSQTTCSRVHTFIRYFKHTWHTPAYLQFVSVSRKDRLHITQTWTHTKTLVS